MLLQNFFNSIANINVKGSSGEAYATTMNVMLSDTSRFQLIATTGVVGDNFTDYSFAGTTLFSSTTFTSNFNKGVGADGHPYYIITVSFNDVNNNRLITGIALGYRSSSGGNIFLSKETLQTPIQLQAGNTLAVTFKIVFG